MGDVWVLLRDWKLVAASLMLAAGLAIATVAPPLVNAEPPAPVSLADPIAPYAGPDADQLRHDDLSWLAQTLESYARVWGAYPKADGPSPVCSRLADVTCILWTSEPDMPASDGRTPYYYKSDGETYAVFALMDYLSPQKCHVEAPPGWDKARTHCIVGPRGGADTVGDRDHADVDSTGTQP